MIRQPLCSVCLLLSLLLVPAHPPLAPATAPGAPQLAPAPPDLAGFGAQAHPLVRPGPTIEPFVRPDLARRLERLRPLILAAAQRHNRPALSGMDDESFAVVIALIIYNENFGWLEDDVPPLRIFTPLYQRLQQAVNQRLPGSNFSVWPVNLRPSVGLEILKQELPLANGQIIHVPVRVVGSGIDPAAYARPADLLAAINAEISRDDLAIAYLAANLERGLYRAALEGAPVTWQTLAAWHNQGIVDPRAIRAHPTARDYVRRAAAFMPLARALIGASGHGAARETCLPVAGYTGNGRARNGGRRNPRAPGRRATRASRPAWRAGAPTLPARTREDSPWGNSRSRSSPPAHRRRQPYSRVQPGGYPEGAWRRGA